MTEHERGQVATSAGEIYEQPAASRGGRGLSDRLGWLWISGAALTLAFLDIAAVILAFGLYRVVQPGNQILFQAPVAALLVCMGCVLFQQAVRMVRPEWMPRWTASRWLAVQLGALFFSAVLFVPLHLVTQGYVTAVSNVLALWLFQLPTNALALTLAAVLPSIRDDCP